MDFSGKTILITRRDGILRQGLHGGGARRTTIRKRFACSAATSSSSPSCRAATRDESRLRFLIGDIRDRDRLLPRTRGVDVIVHAAALKQVPACEYNPFEAVQTNVVGAENVVAAAIANSVPRTLLLSTDKAVNPVNLYGATKLCAGEDHHAGQRLRGRLRRPLRMRALRQRRRQPRQRRPDLPASRLTTVGSRSPTSG